MLTKYPISDEAMYSAGLPPSNRTYLSVGSHFVIVKLLCCDLPGLPGRISAGDTGGAGVFGRTIVAELILDGGNHNDGMRMWFYSS
jgi:hypothetical protein